MSVLPTVSQLQFAGLVCVELDDETSFLRIDTAVSCQGARYEHFIILNITLIFFYQSIPLIWMALLWRQRHELNPEVPSRISPISFEEVSERTLAMRGSNSSLNHIQFLWRDYKPKFYFYEVIFVYMRIVFIAVIPMCGIGFFSFSLLSESASITDGLISLRASFGVCLSLLAVAFTREALPFVRSENNLLNTLAQVRQLRLFFSKYLFLFEINPSLSSYSKPFLFISGRFSSR